MADVLNIYQICPVCKGTGDDSTTVYPSTPSSRQCQNCQGVGEIYWGQMREE